MVFSPAMDESADAPTTSGPDHARPTEQQLAREHDRLKLLLDINNAVVSHLALDDLLHAISESLRRVVPHDLSSLGLYDAETGQLRAHVLDYKGEMPYFIPGGAIPLEGTTGGEAFTTGRPVFINQPDLERFDSDYFRKGYEAGLRSGGNIPLIAHGRKLGVLGLASFRENAFSDDDVKLLCQIANQIAIAVENSLSFERARAAEQQMTRARERSELLLEINNKIATSLDLRELFKEISACLRTLIHHDYAELAFYHAETDRIRLFAVDKADDIEFGKEDRWGPVEGTPIGLAIRSRRTVLRGRPDLIEFPSESMKRAVDMGIRAGSTVPLISRDRVLGALTVASLREGAFTEDDAELLTQVGAQVAIAVDNALNFDAVRSAEKQMARDRDRLRLLLEVNNAVVSHLDLKELVKSISASLRHTIPHDGALLTLYDSESTRLRVHALDFQMFGQVPFEEGELITLGDTPEGRAITTRQPVPVSQVDLAKFSSPWVQHAAASGVRSGCAVPLISHARALGALSVVSLRDAAFAEEDLLLLSQVAGQIAIAVENALAFQQIEALKNKLSEEKLYLEEEINTTYDFEKIIGSSPALKRILKQVETVAPTDSTVLIQGETGTGKELIARAIHSLSERRERTLVKLNCAAIPTGLLESELFGHERGAFTGAIAQRIGRFELAHKGTLFLDEVGEIPLELQPKLLRVLQEQEFERLGSTRTLRVDIRLIAATNRNLAQMAHDRQFRDDLYYRLNVFPITIPPLRERREDIPLLARFFASRSARRMKKRIDTISAETVARLQAYDWPGNIRELENLMERAVILTQGDELQVSFAEMGLQAKPAATDVSQRPHVGQPAAERASGGSGSLEAIEREHILRVLNETEWVVSGPNGAAARLGLKRTTLQARMKKLGIKR